MRNKILISLLLAGACTDVAEPALEDNPELSESESAVTMLATYSIAGQSLRVHEYATLNASTSRIAACGQGTIFASRTDLTLWVNQGSGLGAWTQVTAGTPGARIACDRSHLYALSSSGTLYHAYLGFNGQIMRAETGQTSDWLTSMGGQTLTVPAGTDEIQGGMGNIYALAINSSGVSTLYASQLWNPSKPTIQGSAASWTMLANNLGSAHVTGAGSKITHLSWVHDGLTYRKRNRAFGVNPDDTLYYNDSMLYGINGWSSMPNAGLDIKAISAEGPDDLFVLAVGASGSGRRLVKFEFEETNCTDNLDNDADGETDAEDTKCRRPLAIDWCSTRSAGTTHCMDRIDGSYPHALITCNAPGVTPTIEPGLCSRATTAGNDFLTAPRANTAPSGTAQYCNVHNSDGTWDFEWTGSDPCATLKSRHPGSTIVRAGLYSTTGENSIAIKCSNGGVVTTGIGTAPLVDMNSAVGHTANRCVVTVSPRYLRVFQAPIVKGAWGDPVYGARGYSVGHVFDHLPSCQPNDPDCGCTVDSCAVLTGAYGQPQGDGANTFTHRIDMTGLAIPSAGLASNSYDFILDEGTPLKSLGYGTVVTSRDRDIRGSGGPGTAYQGEVYIRYDVGSNPTYQETFIAYYAHLQKRDVVDGQTVKPGQLIGYAGTTGSSWSPHVHFGLLRLSNTNGRRTGSAASGHAFGYRVPFFTRESSEGAGTGFNEASLPGIVDPFGWRAPTGIDPMGHLLGKALTGWDSVVGWGAWSPAVFTSSEEPPYPGL